MKLLILFKIFFGACLGVVCAQTPAPVVTAPAAPHPILFHPPNDDDASVLPIRVGGGSRGGADPGISIDVLVPEHAALTMQAQPSLYFYQSAAAKTQCEITLTEPKNPKPLLLLKSGAATPAGIHAIRLSKFNVRLKPNVLYRWSVAVVVDPQNRSADIVANGVIRRVAPPAGLMSQVSRAPAADRPSLFAQNGLWYDALQSISDEIDQAPQDITLRQERADLLKQVGLDGTAMAAERPK
jgi:hypothetical protein